MKIQKVDNKDYHYKTNVKHKGNPVEYKIQIPIVYPNFPKIKGDIQSQKKKDMIRQWYFQLHNNVVVLSKIRL